MKKLYLIDAYALIFKFHYALISRPMRNKDGLNTSAIFGFTKFINNIITREKPQYLGVAFDPKGGNFRHKLFPEYKANRAETPEDIIAATPHIKRILEAMKIPILEVAGYEADDVIGTIATKAACNDFEVFMVTPDKDYGQLIQECCYMYKPSRKGEGIEIVGLDELYEHYGIRDSKLIIDILALWGDVADNVPGVPGIGEKTAVKLVNEYGTVESILNSTDKLKGKLKENLENSVETLKLSKTLVTIDCNVPIEFNAESLYIDEPDYELLRNIYTEMNFSSLISDLQMWQHSKDMISFDENPGREVTAEECGYTGEVMLSLFDDVPNVEYNKTDKKEIKQEASTQIISQTNQSLFDFEQEESLKNIKNTNHTYITLSDVNSVKQIATILSMKSEFAFDTETTGLNTISDSLVGLSISYEPHKAYYIPLNAHHRESTIELLEPLRAVLESEKITKIGQNIKFDISMLNSYGFNVGGFLVDTMLLHYLLDSDSRHSMDYLSEKYLNYKPISIEELLGKGAKKMTMDMVSVDIVSEYAAEDADVTFLLKQILWKECEKENLIEIYRTIEEPLINVLNAMERNGVTIDTKSLKTFSVELQEKADAIEKKIKDLAENPAININSAKQIGELLFDKLKIVDKPKRTKTKQYKTDEEYLQSLSDKHPVIEDILEYRGIKKLLTTYVDALPLLVNPKTNRIHTTYNQAVASTGRLSSTNPNLQNIPIRDDSGKNIRKAFVACDDDHLLISADYSQIELRIMASLSKDSALIEAFNNGEDIHRATAAKIFGKELSEVTDDERRKAKTANFGIIYGISAFGLAERLNISRKEAKELIDGYFMSYPGVKDYMDKAVDDARKVGYVETIFGRRKQLNDINSPNAIVRGYAERNAINAPIQGSAADIIKIAMIKLFEALQHEMPEAKMLMQVHDELIIEFKKEDKDKISQIVVDSMENAVNLAVKMVAEFGISDNWLGAH
ncbi:MAG: DNA polymerase I [Rikenellaceae bacterium]